MMSSLRRQPYWLVCILSILAAIVYWGLIASDRYASESNVVLESPKIAAPQLSFQSLLSGGGGNTADMLLLRDHLLSVDMLKTLEKQLPLREHYSDRQKDMLSRLSDPAAPMEDFHRYILKRIQVELDEYAGILRVKTQAYNPEMAQKINQLLLSAGEAHMNHMGQRLAAEQVEFLERQVEILKQRFDQSVHELLSFQNKSGLVSPQATIQTLSNVIGSMQGQLANLQASRTALLSFQSATSPDLRRVEAEIKALQEQIQEERGRLAEASGSALNVVTSQYQLLEMNQQFARDSYAAALAALQNTRIEAARQLKQVSVLQSPTLPEYATAPRRIYSITVFTLLVIFITLMTHMLVLIIKDHKD